MLPQTKILGGWTKRCVCVFERVFNPVVTPKEYSHPWKVLQKHIRNALFSLPNSSFGEHNLAKFMLPKRRVLTVEQTISDRIFNQLFNGQSPNGVLTYVKIALKTRSETLVRFKCVSTRFGLQMIETSFKNAHATLCSTVQNLRLENINLATTSLDGWTNRSDRCFKSLFTYVSTLFGRVTIEKCFENFVLPKRRFWTVEQSVACALSKYASRAWVLVLGYQLLKTRSKTHTQRFVRPSKILRLGSIKIRSEMFVQPSKIFVWWA